MAELYIGLMSGTSLDGIDAVLVRFSAGNTQLVAQHFSPFDEAIKAELLALHTPASNELHRSLLVSNQLARRYAHSIEQLLSSAQISPQQVRAIGCHGQTIRHCPEHGYTVQLGNGALLAELTGITVVNDFRSRDIAAGGQGAPLVPAFHHRLLRDVNIHRVIVNIGGISNLTNLSPHDTPSGFDCGPGNLLMDAWCSQHQGLPYDKGGRWAATGTVLANLLAAMLNEPYFAQPAPKSTGRDLFNMTWLAQQLRGDERPEDVQATLLELTAVSIAQAIQRSCVGATEIYVCGGGAHNDTLMHRLQAHLPDLKIASTSALGISPDYLEAIAFAWLAEQTLRKQTANLPIVTGARHACILGAIHQA
ncbi:MAG: anhydro-N-acetylmuramic acid kinase [Sideroxydans sp.]|nr:anhydro-N-acetylmuramic acid kinase [Sideroxydans sp.]